MIFNVLKIKVICREFPAAVGVYTHFFLFFIDSSASAYFWALLLILNLLVYFSYTFILLQL